MRQEEYSENGKYLTVGKEGGNQAIEEKPIDDGET